MNKETGFSFVLDTIYWNNVNFISTINNPVVIDKFCNYQELHSESRLSAFPKGTIFKENVIFTDCEYLETIPENTVFDKDVTFRNCSSLKTISKGVVFKGNAVFEDCLQINSIAHGVIFNKNLEFTSEFRKPEGYVSESMKNLLTTMKKDGKIMGELYI